MSPAALGAKLSAPQIARCLPAGLWEALEHPDNCSSDAYALMHSAELVQGGRLTTLGRSVHRYPNVLLGLLAANPPVFRRLLAIAQGEGASAPQLRSVSVLVPAGLYHRDGGLTPLGAECVRRHEVRLVKGIRELAYPGESADA